MRGAASFAIGLALIACGGTTATSSATDGGAATAGSSSAGAGGSGGGGYGGDGGGGQSGSGGAAAIGNAGADGGGADVAAACAQYAQMACAEEAQCAPFILKWQFDNAVSRCESWAASYCQLEVEAVGSHTTASWIANMTAKLATLSCEQAMYGTAGYVPEPAGDRADGQPCVINSQCASTVCTTALGEACGSCEHAGKSGDSCGSDSGCVRGYDCAAGKCVLAAGLDDACDDSHPCLPGLTCAGTCQITPSGGPCPDTRECGGYITGEFCDGTTCQASALSQPGDACSGYALCTGGNLCDGATCPAARVPAGGACTDTSQCDFITYCKNGVCTWPANDCP